MLVRIFKQFFFNLAKFVCFKGFLGLFNNFDVLIAL